VKVFAARPLDSRARTITLAAIVGGTAGILIFIFDAIGKSGTLITLVGAPVLVMVLLLLPYARSPEAYGVDPDWVIVFRRTGRPSLYARKGLRRCLPAVLSRARYVSGSRGLFGWWGRFRDPNGVLRAFVTDRHSCLLLEWQDGTRLVLSPADTDGFAAALGLQVLRSAERGRGKNTKGSGARRTKSPNAKGPKTSKPSRGRRR